MLIIPNRIKEKYSSLRWDELQVCIREADETTQWELALYFTNYYKYLWLKNRSIAPHLCAEDFMMIVVTDTKAILKQFSGRSDRYFLFMKNFSFMKRSVNTRIDSELKKRYSTDYLEDGIEVAGVDYYVNWEAREVLLDQIVEEDDELANTYLTCLIEFIRNEKSWIKTGKALGLKKNMLEEIFESIAIVAKSPLRKFIITELGV